jgi:hypothetical protein
MTVKHVWMGLVLAAAVVACEKSTGATYHALPPLANFRYFDAVPDTGYMDFRIVDIVAYAPNTVRAIFRTGGNPMGISTTLPPPYLPVQTGLHHIRVFLDSLDIVTASQIMFDTTFTFQVGQYYTLYLYGSARTPPLKALITTDSVPSLATGQIAVRVLNLAPDLSGNPVGSAATVIDGQVGVTTSAVPVPTAVASNVGYGQASTYTALAASGTTTPYRLAVTATGTTSPILFQATMPFGIAGTAAVNPIAGTAVAGTAITAVIVPRSVVGSAAPQSTASSVTANIDSVTRSNDTVTVWRHVTAGNGTTTCNTAVAAGASLNDVLHITGLSPVDYNGSNAVVSVTAGASQNAWPRQTITLSNTSAGAAYRLILNPGTASADTTLPITFDSDSSTVRAALAARAAIGGNANVGVAGAAGGPYTVTFKGALANTTVAQMGSIATLSLGVAIATLPVSCQGTATSSRFRYRIATTPVSPATGTASYKIVTSGNEFTAPTIIYLIDLQPPLTSP